MRSPPVPCVELLRGDRRFALRPLSFVVVSIVCDCDCDSLTVTVTLTVTRQLPEGKMAGISLKDFSNEISPANEKAARKALKEVRGVVGVVFSWHRVVSFFLVLFPTLNH